MNLKLPSHRFFLFVLFKCQMIHDGIIGPEWAIRVYVELAKQWEGHLNRKEVKI